MDTAKVIKTPEYLRILNDEKKLTFATMVDGHELHHQISILEYDTREKIENKMAQTLAQVAEEFRSNNKSTANETFELCRIKCLFE
jgi:hypothetical protein